MTNVRKFMPKTEAEVGVKRALTPFTQGMEEFLENFLPRSWMGSADPAHGRRSWDDFEAMRDSYGLRFDMIDRDHDLAIRAELPGVKKENIHITIAGEYLTIEADRAFSDEESNENFFRSELVAGHLARTIILPVEVEPEKVMARLMDGILEITLPKIRAVKRHEINVA